MKKYLALWGMAAAALLAGCQPSSDEQNGGAEANRVSSTDEFQSRNGTPIDPENHPGKALFEQNCVTCHNGTVPKAPAVVWLEMLEPDMVLSAMKDGIMKQQAAHLSAIEQQQIAEYLARIELSDYKPPAPPPVCAADKMNFDGPPPSNVGWGHDNSRFIPTDIGGLEAKDLKNVKLQWAFSYPSANRARSQPAIGWNTIFVGSQTGTVYAFDLEEGCTRWTYRASAEVRTAIVADAKNKRLYFGDVLGRVYALDAMTGKQLWQVKADPHPNATITGSPSLGGGILAVPVSSLEVTSAADPKYNCCSFRGVVVGLDPATGAEKWKTYTIPDAPKAQGKTSAGAEILGPSGAPVWGSPTYDTKRNRFYFGSGENYSSPADKNSDALFAVDASNGKKLWQVQFTANDAWNVGCMMGNENCPKEQGPDLDVAASPLLIPIDANNDIIVVGQKSGMTYGVNPTTGKIIWSQRLGHGGTQGGVHFGMAREGTTVYVPIVDMVDTADGRTYDKALNGAGIHAVNAASGKILWRQKADNICAGKKYCDPGISAAATAIPGAVLAGHLDGRLRGYDSKTGSILWSFDTTQEFTTVNGTKAHGGAMSGPGPSVYGGYVVANSGYGLYFHMPGNVLLVFKKP